MSNSQTSPRTWLALINDATFFQQLEQAIVLPYANSCPWFSGKDRPQTELVISQVHEIPASPTDPTLVARLLILDIAFADDAPSEQYVLPLSWLSNTDPALADVPTKGRIGSATLANEAGWLVDAVYVGRFRLALFEQMVVKGSLWQESGWLRFGRGRGLDKTHETITTSRVLPVDSSYSALVFGPTGAELYLLKLYRKLFPQTDTEEKVKESSFQNIPAYTGELHWEPRPTETGFHAPTVTLGMMQQIIPNPL